MHIDKYKVAGEYVLDGCHYDDAISLIHTGFLGMCGCGLPEVALEQVRKGLQAVEDKVSLHAVSPDTLFMFYFLDTKKLTEHGSSIPGWLSAEGRELLEDLNCILQEGSDA